ncbi:methyltransferase [Streptomyces sp. NPDC059578]|uniref:methyltransferase n=1 Tax=unclassified Streptomyces TaxID=2593676 RepID=UPI00365AE522
MTAHATTGGEESGEPGEPVPGASDASSGPVGSGAADRMMSMITGYWRTQIVRTVAELSIPDHLADGPLTALALAERIDADPDGVARLLRACASLGLVEVDADRRFHRTPLLDTLRTGSPHSLRTIALVHGSPGHWLPWGHFPQAVRSGTPQTSAALGRDIWAHFLAHPREGERFASSMTELTAHLAEEVAALLDTTGARVAVDVGGANGALVHALLRADTRLRGIVVDLPAVAATALATAQQAGLSDRVTVLGGSFFDPLPPGDLFLLKAVLHNWDDDACVAVLRNCRTALNPGGRVVVVEMPLGPPGEPGFAPLLDLDMLAVLPGRERELTHYDTLFEAAGLRRTRVTPTRSPQSIIEAVAG